MSDNVVLRFNWSCGTAVFNIPRQDALKVVVALRGLGLGLSIREGSSAPMETRNTAEFIRAETIIKRIRCNQALASLRT